ncbi:MAG: hypothetical protein IID41_02895 [Planctomycetes bacterium]|nr:hypothetical protein [Planctomycetota bacterium]
MNLDDLSSGEFWRSVSEDRYTQITTVIPTGRATNNTSGHLALSSDGMFMPEIVLEIDRLSRNAGLKGVRVRSMFDIDFYDALQSVVRNAGNRESAETDGEDHCIDSNLVVVGTADINIIALELLNAVDSIAKYKMGCPKPYESALIKGGRGHLYSQGAEPDAGLLALYRNPWARRGQRVALFCGGVKAASSLFRVGNLCDGR